MGTSAYAVTSIGTNIYYFGGFCSDKSYDNSLNVLDVEDSLTWRNINGQDTCTTEAVTTPIKKSFCGMIDIGDKMVLVVGGRGMVPNTKHPNFQYIHVEGREGCVTNEQHICQLDSGTCKSFLHTHNYSGLYNLNDYDNIDLVTVNA